jgi:glycine C-acetyltransferase
MVMVDDSHAAGVLGATGAGTPELFGVRDRVDLVSGTLGKALGGASGGFVSGRGPLIELLRQRARPYLFSNAVPPMVVAGSRTALRLAHEGSDARARLAANAARFRGLMTEAGFDLLPGEHAIVPVMIPDAAQAQALAARLLEAGVYVRAFAYPVVPLGRSRLRVQLSAAHTLADMDRAAEAFIAAGAA